MNADDPIELARFDPSWAGAFADEAAAVTSLLSPYGLVTVEHIGSTAVPGTEAKPVIDMMAGFRALEDRDAAVPLLEARGYRHWYEGPTRSERFFFVRGLPPDAARRSHHLHAVLHDGAWWRRHLLFRDRLRASPTLQAEYVELKRLLADRFRLDREAYTAGKTEFVERVLGAT